MNSDQGATPALFKKPARLSSTIFFATFLAMLNIFLAMPAWAATDAVVGTGTPASCTEAALETALAAGGTITFNCGAAPHTIVLTGAKNLNVDMTVDGDNLITLSGGNATRIFNIAADKTVTLRELVLVDTPNSASGLYNSGTLIVVDSTFRNHLRGAIYNAGGTITVLNGVFEDNERSAITNENAGTLSVTSSTFRRNKMMGSGYGGAIYGSTGSTNTISNSLFEENQAGESGGAIYNSHLMTITRSIIRDNEAYGGGGIGNSGTLLIRDSHISFNDATGVGGAGGGISHFNQSTTPSRLTILNSTLDNNSATKQGGAIWVSGEVATLELTNSTVYSNTSLDFGGGGIYVTSADATLTNVTLSDNTSLVTTGGSVENSPNLPGTILLRNTLIVNGGCEGGGMTDGGGNLQFPDGGCGVSVAAQDPALAAPADNGGWTPTMAFAENGPAQNAGLNANCPATDQRGVLRPQFTTCDVGAFEWGALPTLANIAPESTLALSPTFTLVVEGSNFVDGPSGSRVRWGDETLPTLYVNATTLHATVNDSRIVAGGQVSITVETPVVDGGVSDHTELFTIIKRDQTIDFGALQDRGLEPATFEIEATATSGLAVSFVASGVCTVAGDTVTLSGETGTCTITAQQAGNASYNAAPDVQHSFNVTDDEQMFIPHIFGKS